jgi:hypothetical protein
MTLLFPCQVEALIQGSLTIADFEQWVYAHPEIENEVGADVYVDILSLNFRDSTAVWETLDRWARNTANIRCPPSIRRWIVHTAQQILSGSLDVVKGAAELSRLEMTNEDVQGDPDLLEAEYIYAVGDDLSAGADPSLLHPDRLLKVEEFKKWARGAIRPHLVNLIERYRTLPDGAPLA